MLFFTKKYLEYKCLAIILAEPPVRRSHRLQGLPPEFPPTIEERQGVTTNKPATAYPSLEGVPIVESRE